MWTCPKCGRTFARNGQEHYCGKPPETIEEYILNQPEKAQPLLKEINETIRAAIPWKKYPGVCPHIGKSAI